MRLHPLILASLLIGLLSSVAPASHAGAVIDSPSSRQYYESFDSFIPGQAPTGDYYTITTTANMSSAVTSPQTGTDNEWRLSDAATGAGAEFAINGRDGVSADLCRSGATFQFTFDPLANPSLASDLDFRLVNAATTPSAPQQPTNSVGVIMTGASGSDAVSPYIRGSGTATTIAKTANYATQDPVTVLISQVNCGSGVGGARICATGAVTFCDSFVTNSLLTGPLNALQVVSYGTAATGTSFDIDNIILDGQAVPNPTIGTVSPTQGNVAGGNELTVTGTGFLGTPTVTVGGTSATVTCVHSTFLCVTAPPHAAGLVNIVVTNPNGATVTKTSAYRYLANPIPSVGTVSPSSGTNLGGTMVNVTGSNFDPAFRATLCGDVNNDGNPASQVTYISSTNVKVTTPPADFGSGPGIGHGSCNLKVCNPDGQCGSRLFTYKEQEETTTDGDGSESPPSAYTNVDDSLIANSGLAAGIAVNGSIIAIAHKTTANAVILTYSLDAGATWIDKGTSGTTSSLNRLVPVIVNETTFGIFYNDPASSGPVMLRTTDGGNQWTTANVVGYYPWVWTCSPQFSLHVAASFNSRMWITQFTSGNNVQNQGCLSEASLFYSDNAGLTWTRSGGFGACGAPLALQPYGTVSVRVYTANGAGSCMHVLVNGTQVTSSTNVDSFTGETVKAAGLTAAQGAARYVAFKDGSLTKVAIPVGDTNWIIKNAGTSPTTSLSIGSADTFARLVQSLGANQDSMSAWTASYGNTFAGSQVQAPGPTDAQPAIYVGCGSSWIAGRNQASNSLAIYHDSTTLDCTDPTGVVASLAPAANRTNITGIVGFDMDDNGGTIVLRTEAGDKVRTLAAATLVDSSPIVDTNCGLTEGVMAQRSISRSEDIIGYLHCANPNDVSQVRIRGSDLGDLDLPGYCNDDCKTNIDDEDTAEPEDDLYEIRGMAGFPFDYSASDTTGTNSIYLSWGFSTDDGRIGVNTVTFNNVDQDLSIAPMKKLMHSGQPIDQLCSARDDNQRQDYIYGMQSNGDVAGYSVSYKKITSNPNSLTPLMTNVFGGVDTARPAAIACAQDRIFVMLHDGSAAIYKPNTPDKWIVSNGSDAPVARAATMSPDATVGAYIADGLVKFFNVQNGTPRGSFPAPTIDGNERFIGMKLTKLGQSVVIVTTNNVYRWDTAAISGTDGVRPCTGCNRDGDSIPDERDPDIDGDGLLNNEDPDIDGDGKCNAGLAAQPAGTPGAVGGCQAGDLDDDGDGINNDQDTSPHGPGGELPPGSHVPCGVPNFPDCGKDGTTGGGGSGSGVARIFNRFSVTTQFLIGLVIIGIVAGLAYYLAGPAPMVVGGAATLGICAAVALGLFGIWVPITIGASGIAAFAAAVAKKVGGART